MNLAAASRSVAAIYCVAVAWYIGLWMYPNFPLFIDFLNDGSDAPRFDLLLLALTVPLALATWRRWFEFLRHPYFLWTLALAALYAINALRAPHVADVALHGDDVSAEVDRLQRAVLLPVYGYLAYVLGRERLMPPLLVAVVLLPTLVTLDFFFPQYFTRGDPAIESPRADGTLLNPNVAGEALLITLVLVHRRLSGVALGAVFLIVGVGEILTFSRGGLVAWLLFGVYLILSGRVPRWSVIVLVAAVAFYSTLIIYAEEILSSIFTNNEQLVAELVDRLSFTGDESARDDYSTEERQYVALAALRDIAANPILGHVYSPAVRYGQGAHNQLLEYWYVYGIGGLIVCLWLAWLLNRRAPDRFLGLVAPEAGVFLWFAMFSHTLFVYNFMLIFAAVTICGQRGVRVSDHTPTPLRLRLRFGRERQRGKRRRRTVAAGAWRGRFD